MFKKEIPSSLSSEYPQNTCLPNRGSLLQNWSSEIFLLFLRSFDRTNFPIERLFKLLLCHRHQNIAESDNNSFSELVQEGLEADHINGSDLESHGEMEEETQTNIWQERPSHHHSCCDTLEQHFILRYLQYLDWHFHLYFVPKENAWSYFILDFILLKIF